MNQKKIWNHAVQEGIFFLLAGGILLIYGLDSHHKGFNQDWSQSPYLFPVLVAVLMGILAVSLIGQGLYEAKAEDASAKAHPDAGKNTLQVLIVLGLALLYYLSLAVLKIPYITFGILSYSLTISNFEIVTVVFLFVMMVYLGVRKIPVLVLVPVGTSLFLSVTFRAMLHVLLP